MVQIARGVEPLVALPALVGGLEVVVHVLAQLTAGVQLLAAQLTGELGFVVVHHVQVQRVPGGVFF